tara:strand:- start:480 stop:842 length:363 start_codon:yes stop_codon:yes gene_type:complete
MHKKGGGVGKWIKHHKGLATAIGVGTGAILLAPLTGGASLAESIGLIGADLVGAETVAGTGEALAGLETVAQSSTGLVASPATSVNIPADAGFMSRFADKNIAFGIETGDHFDYNPFEPL